MVERCAQRVDVAAGVDILVPPRLLGRDVVGGSHRGARAGLRGVLLLVGKLHQPEVAELGDPVPREHDVVGLDVAVDQAVVERVVEGPADLGDDVDRAALVDRATPLEQFADGGSVDELHGEIMNVVGLADVDPLDDVGVVELGHRPGLAQEPLPEPVVGSVLGREALDRHDPVHRYLQGLVDGAHGALADLADDLVALDGQLAPLLGLASKDLLRLLRGDVPLRQHDVAQPLGGRPELLDLGLEPEALVDPLESGESELDGQHAEILTGLGVTHGRHHFRQGGKTRKEYCRGGSRTFTRPPGALKIRLR